MGIEQASKRVMVADCRAAAFSDGFCHEKMDGISHSRRNKLRTSSQDNGLAHGYFSDDRRAAGARAGSDLGWSEFGGSQGFCGARAASAFSTSSANQRRQ